MYTARERNNSVCFYKSFLESIFLQVSPVHSKMSPQFIRSCKSLRTVGPCADIGLLSCVGTHVGFKVIRSGEFSLADLALEWPDACVLAAVSSQLVRS